MGVFKFCQDVNSSIVINLTKYAEFRDSYSKAKSHHCCQRKFQSKLQHASAHCEGTAYVHSINLAIEEIPSRSFWESPSDSPCYIASFVSLLNVSGMDKGVSIWLPWWTELNKKVSVVLPLICLYSKSKLDYH